MYCQISIAELEPCVRPESAKRLKASEAVATDAPAALRVGQTSQGVGYSVQIGGYMEAVNLCVIGRVSDDEDALGRQHARQPVEKTRCSYPACERDHRAAAHR